MRFHDDMNILNLAIHHQKINIIRYLSTNLNEAEKRELSSHQYGSINSVHQVVSLGNPHIIRLVI